MNVRGDVMGKEEILQLKKEVVVLSDYPEIYDNEELNNNLASMRVTAENEYAQLITEDKSWVDYNFNRWLEYYLGNSCSGGCGGCSCECY